MLFDIQDNMNYFLKNMINMENDNLVNDSTGLIRGNMFNNEYITYKGIEPNKIIIDNEKEELILKLYETNFAIIDLGLYLDLHSDDTKTYNIFKKYVKDFERYKEIYETSYGPLMNTYINNDSYKWPENPWPWDNDGGNKYV